MELEINERNVFGTMNGNLSDGDSTNAQKSTAANLNQVNHLINDPEKQYKQHSPILGSGD